HRSERRTLTASYDQVRQPIYRGSVKRHEHYAAHLGPLVDALASPAIDDQAWEDTGAAGRLFEAAAEAHRNGNLGHAETLYRDILAHAPRHAPTLMQLGLLLQGKGKGVGEALELFRMAARVEPGNASIRNALGQALLEMGAAGEAQGEFLAAIEADPAFAAGHHNLGLALAGQGRFAEAVAHFRKGLEHEPDDARALTHLGQALAETGDWGAAELALARAAELQPAVPQIRLALGDVLMHAGNVDGALAAYRELDALVPGEPAGAQRLAMALQQTGEVEDAVTALETARRKAPSSPALLCELANAYALAGEDGRAAGSFRAAAGHGAPAAASRGLAALGDLDAARDLLTGLTGDDPELALARAETAAPSGLATAQKDLQAALARDDLPAVMRRQLLFALARNQYRLGDGEAALETAHQANRLKGARFDLAAETALVDRIIAAFPASAASTTAPGAPRPVFVVGMQRAGVRLVERMLAAHSRVAGLGPAGLLHATARRFGGQGFGYLDDIGMLAGDAGAEAAARHRERMAARAGDAAWAVEAIPGDAFHLGLVRSLFLDARVVICRRDPLDAGLACYFEDFAGASPYAYDLADIGAHARNVDRLLNHWRQSLALPVRDVAFEDCIAQPAATAQALLDFLELGPEAACAAAVDPRHALFHHEAQALGSALAPLAEALGETKSA
ncbi:MAG: tetratricopeptide repeat protein, partial [Alphaproteobacteria bacterium]|nr:tetratricopeptide repeat protein [Alphaproteobacteria bacterium]